MRAGGKIGENFLLVKISGCTVLIELSMHEKQQSCDNTCCVV